MSLLLLSTPWAFPAVSLLLEDTACASQAKGRLTPWQRSSLKLPAGTLPTVMGIHFLPPPFALPLASSPQAASFLQSGQLE